LVPTSAPGRRFRDWRREVVSVDQVGADVGTAKLVVQVHVILVCPSIRLVPTSAPGDGRRDPFSGGSVRRSGWCRRRHQIMANITRYALQCPSIRLVPTSAPVWLRDHCCG